MDWNEIASDWDEMKAAIRARWGRLTNSDVDRIGGDRDQLAETIVQKYGWSREQVEKDLQAFALSQLLTIDDFFELEDGLDKDDIPAYSRSDSE